MTDDGLKNTANFINNAIAQVLTRQQSDGSIGRRDATETKNTLEKYLLTTYTYGALRTLQNRYSAPGQLDSALARIESYLWNYRTTSDSTFMRYLAQKTQAGKALNKDEVHTLDGLKPLNITYG